MWTVTFPAFIRAALRDRISLYWAVAFPLVLVVGLGTMFPDPAYRDALFGGVLFLSAVFFAANGTAFAVSDQRSRGVYKLVRTAPGSTARFVLAFSAARLVVAIGLTAMVAVGGAIYLGVRLSPAGVAGGIVALLPILAAFALIGFTMGNVADEPGRVAAINNLVTLPATFLTSALYSLDMLPDVVAKVAVLLPFEHAVRALRAGLEGDFAGLLPELGSLAVFLAAASAVAVATFRWDTAAPLRFSFRVD